MGSRRVSLTVLALFATPWAGLLTMSGVWLLLIARDHPALGIGLATGIGPWPRVVAGVTAVSAGLLVFMCLVADRMFPRASRAVVASVEMAASAVVFLGVAWLSVMLTNLIAPWP